MTISALEQADVDKLKKESDEKKIQAFDYMRSISMLDEAGLKNCGFKSKEEGYAWSFNQTNKQILELQKAFFKKWPD
jgi:hypothetical protein